MTECKKEIKKRFKRSLKGKLSTIYDSQTLSSRKRGHEPQKYTREEFIARYLQDPTYVQLHSDWVDSDYTKRKSPSFDRKNDSIGYTFSNIQLMSWKGNHSKASKGIKSSTLVTNHKQVVQYDKAGVELGRFNSIAEAGRAVGIERRLISAVVNGRTKSTRDGSVWKVCTD